MKSIKLNDTLIANLFNPDKLIREATAKVIYEIAPEAYAALGARISDKHKKELDALIFAVKANQWKTLMFTKIKFLKSIPVFSHISGGLLALMADHIEEVHYKAGEVIYQDKVTGMNPVSMVFDGLITLSREDGSIEGEYGTKYLLGDELILDSDVINYTVTAAVDTIIF